MCKQKNISEPALNKIAVIGMSGRFPGAKELKEFWENLREGKESVSFFSNRELGETGVDPINIKAANYVKAGGILDEYTQMQNGII